MISKIFSSRFVALLMFMYALSFAVFKIAFTAVDPDIFFILTLGRDILVSGEIPQTLLHTVHTGYSTLIQQYLTDCMDYLFYAAMGFKGVYLLSILFFSATATVAYMFISRNVCYNLTAGIILLSLVMPVMALMANGRPQMVTQLLFYILLYVSDINQRRWQYLIPPVMVYWPAVSILQINFHASTWPFLLCVAAALCMPELLHPVLTVTKGFPERLCALVLMVFAGLLNPHGIKGMTYLFTYEFNKGNTIPVGELEAPVVFSLSGAVVVAAVLVILLYLYLERGHVRTDYLALAAGTTFLGLVFIRCAWMAAYGTLPLLVKLTGDYALDGGHSNAHDASDTYDVYDKYGRVDIRKLIQTPDAIFPLTAICFFIVAIVASGLFVMSGKHISDSSVTPVKAVRYLDTYEADKNPRLLTTYNNGAFCEFNGYQIYIDARNEPFSKPINGKKDVIGECYSLLYDPDFDYLKFIAEYDFDYLVLPNRSFAYIYLRDGEYTDTVVDGSDYVLLRVKKDAVAGTSG